MNDMARREEKASDDVPAPVRRRVVADDVRLPSSTSSEADRMGREQQRRATAYARARGQL